jgi:hypothetical protein
LATAQQDIQQASRELVKEWERAEALGGERPALDQLYVETITKVALADQAIEISQELAQQSKQMLEEIIQQRVAERKARKKAFWNELLSTVSVVLALIAGVMMLFPPTAAIGGLAIAQIGLVLSLVSGAISATQAAINGDWMGAIFNGIMAATSFVSGGLSQGLKAVANTAQKVWGMTQTVASKVMSSIKIFQSLASGAYSGVRNILSGDSIMGFLQMMGGLANAATAGIGGFVEGGVAALDSFGQFGYKVLESLSKAPTLIYGGIKAIENGDLVNGISNVVKGIVSLTKTWTNDFNSDNESIGEKVANALENISSVGIGVSKFITGGLDGLLDGLGDMLDGLGDDISKALEKLIPGNDCECECPCPELNEEELEEEAEDIFDETIENAHDDSLTAEEQKQAELDALSERLQDEDLDPRVKAKVVDQLDTTEEQAEVIRQLPDNQQKEVFHNLPETTQKQWIETYLTEKIDQENLLIELENNTVPEDPNLSPVDPNISVLIGGVEKPANNYPILDFIWGTIQGEFNDNPSFGQIILDTLIGMIPGLGEMGDIRDLSAYVDKFSKNPEEMKDPWNWVGVFGALVGLIPVAGGLGKGLLKAIRKAANEFAQNSVQQAIKKSITLKHAVTNPRHVKDIIRKIDPDKLDPKSRFGPAFYLAENGQTAIIELKAHNKIATNIISFDLDLNQARILDLSDPQVSTKWNYDSSKEYAGEIAQKAINEGFNVIKYPSVQSTGDNYNYAVLKDFEQVLTPGHVESVQANNIVPYNVVRAVGRLSEIPEQNAEKK